MKLLFLFYKIVLLNCLNVWLIYSKKENYTRLFGKLYFLFQKQFGLISKFYHSKKALHLPFFVSLYAKVKGVNKKNFIVNIDKPTFGCCRIGVAGSETGLFIKKRSAIYIHNKGEIVINSPIALSRGIYLEANGGKIIIGKEIKANTGCYFEAQDALIEIGDYTSFGWNCVVKNCDGHTILLNGEELENKGDIHIGKHCWICSESSILKNGYLGDDCVLAYKSILTKKISDKNGCLYAGIPAKLIKENISWKV